MYRMTDEEFETAIAEALDAMPEQFMEALNNVAIVWEEEPSAYHVGYDEEWDIEPAFVEDEDGPESYTPAERDAKTTQQRKDAGGEYEAEDDEDEFDDLLGLFERAVHRGTGQRLRRRHPRRHHHLQRPTRSLLQQPRGNRGRGRQDHHP